MANGGLIDDYLTRGAGSPSAFSFPGGSTGVPSLGDNATETARYLNTTNNHEYAWDGSAWQDVSGGTAGLTLITDTLISGSAAATIDFTSIPGTYKHLQVRGQVRADTSASNDRLRVRLNADSTTAHYAWDEADNYAAGTTQGSESASDTAISSAYIPANTAPANAAGDFVIDIQNYAGTVFDKTVLTAYVCRLATGSGGINVGRAGGYWLSTAAVTEVTLSLAGGGNFIIGSRVSLYGVS